MAYHHAEIYNRNIHLEGTQAFLLDRLLERLRIIMASDAECQREHVAKFFDVWSEVTHVFGGRNRFHGQRNRLSMITGGQMLSL